MNKFLCKIFIKDYDKVTEAKVRKNYGLLSGIIGIITNALLFFVKLTIGLLSGSISIIADSINNLSDMSSSIITIMGFKLASMPEDKEHPYGHARFEYISGIIVSILIIVAGLESAKASLHKIIHPEPIEFSWILFSILALSILVKIWQCLFYKYCARAIKSVTLETSSKDSRNDVITTTVIALSLLIYHYAGINPDGPMALIVSAYIILSGFSTAKETISPLLGEKPDPELVKNIRDSVLSYKGVLGMHDLIVHSYGPGKNFVSIHIEVDGDGDFMASHDLIDNIEREISQRLNIVMTAHLDPIKIGDPLIKSLTHKANLITENIHGLSHIHDLRIVEGPSHTNVIFDVVISSSCILSEEEIYEEFKPVLDIVKEQQEKEAYLIINFDGEYTN